MSETGRRDFLKLAGGIAAATVAIPLLGKVPILNGEQVLDIPAQPLRLHFVSGAVATVRGAWIDIETEGRRWMSKHQFAPINMISADTLDVTWSLDEDDTTFGLIGHRGHRGVAV